VWAANARGDESHGEVKEPLISAPANALPLTIESGVEIAREYAARWSDRAVLIAVTMRLDWPDDRSTLQAGELPHTGWVIYVFTDGEQTLSLYLDRGTGYLLAEAESLFGSGAWSPLDLTTYPRSSTIAAAAADILNGHVYQADCPASRETAFVSASHALDEAGIEVPAWVVTYGDESVDLQWDIVVTMNAVTGEVIDNRSRNRPCSDS
jgi:hypothetical protein